jgi:hypothetical protein
MISPFAIISLPLVLYLGYDLSWHRGFPCPNAKRKFFFFWPTSSWSGSLGPVLFYGPPPLIVKVSKKILAFHEPYIPLSDHCFSRCHMYWWEFCSLWNLSLFEAVLILKTLWQLFWFNRAEQMVSTSALPCSNQASRKSTVPLKSFI